MAICLFIYPILHYPFILLHAMADARFADMLPRVVSALTATHSYQPLFHAHRDGEPLPSLSQLSDIIALFRAILFPGYYGYSSVDGAMMAYRMGVDIELLYRKLTDQILAGLCFDSASGASRVHASRIAAWCIECLPHLRHSLMADVVATFEGDPAAVSYGEVISCYPGIRAITNYRIAHELYLHDVPLIPRIITEMAHSETGIDIHPAAVIGHSFTIDHGTGIVIGATSILGDHVKLYQGVTLGAKNFPLDAQGNPVKGVERHPILEDGVVVYSNSTILGRVTIGHGAVIGANMWVTTDVPPGAKVLQRFGAQ